MNNKDVNIKNLLNDPVNFYSPISNPVFPIEEWDYLNTSDKAELHNQWKNFSEAEREQYKNNIKFFLQEKDIKPTDAQNNYRLIWSECEKRLQPNSAPQILEISDFNKEKAVYELLDVVENTDKIKQIYRKKKLNLSSSSNAGISAESANELRSCFIQGRQLFDAGKNSPMMVKPLIYFYSFAAYVYGMVVMNNPLRYKLGMMHGSHGADYEKFNVKFGGGPTIGGTFSDLFLSFPVINHLAQGVEILQDNRSSIKQFWNYKFNPTIGTLLSMVPELREYYNLVSKKNSRSHQLLIKRSNSPRSIEWDFLIGDGKVQPTINELQKAFPNEIIGNHSGKSAITIPDEQVSNIRAMIFSDIHGDFWFIENPLEHIVLPEICVHYLIMFAFSNIMRYKPDTWNEILTNETDSEISFLIRKYISIFEYKYPVLLTRSLTEYFTIFSKNP
ncbi:YaaC family protein [Paenibacillus hunanensis]|uniref:YaaC family protein n=1 Tax=Paenibacillus hunanensis TaxID=539262 RepID=UPI002A6B4738|nr:YaaC family protein [Paenibacillus hunanensis]WPP40768.1 YaaC family protein [Paenibacillus hunanensis]